MQQCFCWECMEVKEYTFSPGVTDQMLPTTISNTKVKCDESEAEIRKYEREGSKQGVVSSGDDERRDGYPLGAGKKTTVSCKKQ